MSERQPDLDKRLIRLPDGRRLVFYRFPEQAGPQAPPSRPRPEQAPPGAEPAPRPPGEEG